CLVASPGHAQTEAPIASRTEEVEALNEQVEHLTSAGNSAEALTLARRVVTLAEQQLGPAHLQLARALDNLGQLYYTRGDYDGAEPLYQRALRIRTQVLEPGHPDIAQSLNNLALLYYARKDYSRAEPLLQAALGIYEQRLGAEHADVATALNNLAA